MILAFNWASDFLLQFNVSETIASYINLLINITLSIITIIVAYLITKRFFIQLAVLFSLKTKTQFDDILVKNRTIHSIAYLVPLLLSYWTIPLIFDQFVTINAVSLKIIKIIAIILFLNIFRSIFKSVKDFLKEKPKYNDKPIDSYTQVIMIFLWIFGVLSILSILFDIKETTFITAFGSISALIILIFRDTILGLVASVSVSANDMVHIGDWITIDKYGADGNVEEINLATVKVRNFDNTTTTVPTYSLISDSFKNWRGMMNSGGRRIKRHILIRQKSVKFVTIDELKELKKIQLLKNYINHRQTDIDNYNEELNIDKSVIINGRNLTNLGLYRKYITQYISQHSGVNKDMTLMVRHLQPTEKGIPVEVYCFSNDKVWKNYEYIMADIFDHLIAATEYFNLEIFEYEKPN